MSADPIRVLEHLSPHEGWSARTDLDADPVAARILDRVLAENTNVVSLDAARRRRRGIGGAIVVAALLAGGAVAAVWNRSPQEASRVTCWSDANVPPVELIGLRWDGQDDPVQLCSDEWSSGSFEETPPPDELAACVTDREVAAVIPGSPAVCESLGYSSFVPSLDDQTVAANDAARELERVFFVQRSCVPPEDAVGEITRVLDRYGFGGRDFQIVVTSRGNEPCTTVRLDVDEATIYVASTPRPP